jgi:hypothetical protein
MGDARIDLANANARTCRCQSPRCVAKGSPLHCRRSRRARTCRRETSRHALLWRIRGLRDVVDDTR